MTTAKSNFFGSLIKEKRFQARLSQSQLAELANYDRTYISLLERGKRQPNLISIFRITTALELDPVPILNHFRVAAEEPKFRSSKNVA